MNGVPAGAAAGGGSAWPEELKAEFEVYLERLPLPGEDAVPGLAEAMRYSLLAGGKRIRPVLALATQRSLGRDLAEVMPLAAALEMIHTYSLIHDDLPAMDDDDLRRGRPTLHRAKGEAVAILAGDALYAEAFNLLLSSRAVDGTRLACAAAELASATGVSGMVGGQYLDVEVSSPPGGEGLVLLHGMKTGRLIEASCRCVLALAGVEGERADSIRDYSSELGLLFQIIDDILDVTGSDSGLGKPAGSDERQGRRTFVSEFGLEGAMSLAEERRSRAKLALLPLGDEAAELAAIADHVATRES